MCWLSWFITSYFGAIHSEKCVLQPEIKKITKTPYLGGSCSFKVNDIDSPKKLVRTA